MRYVNTLLFIFGGPMENSSLDVGAVIERILSAYGVITQKELAQLLDMAPNNVSSWQQRGSIPGNVIIKCALDTGASLEWIISGKLANAKKNIQEVNFERGEVLYESLFHSGGKPVLRRIMDAHGFSLQKQIGEAYGLSEGTISTWVRRDYFPAELVIASALDTGVSLRWLATGKGGARSENNGLDAAPESDVLAIKKYSISDGELNEIGVWKIDKEFFDTPAIKPALLKKNSDSWVIDLGVNVIGNGKWLLNIDGDFDVYEVARIPGNKLKVSGGNASFECSVNDVELVGKVLTSFIK
jgi:transcriptional regulator with XRE-family HTH domain